MPKRFNHKDTKTQRLCAFVSLWLLIFVTVTACIAQDQAQLDLKSIPVSDWLNAGETTEIILAMQLPGLPPVRTMRSLQRFAAEVLPHIKALGA